MHGFNDPTYNTLLDQQKVTGDESQRREVIARMLRIIAEQSPMVPLYHPTRTMVYRTSVVDSLYYTPGGFAGGNPGGVNKAALITGTTSGTSIRS